MKLFLLFALCFFSVLGFSKGKTLEAGFWHTEFVLNETSILPVSFMVEKTKEGLIIKLMNADESIVLNDISRRKDSLFIYFPTFDSELKARIVKKNKLEGAWYNYTKGSNYAINFTSEKKYKSRFPKMGSTISIYGKWEVTFDYDQNPEKAIGIFDSITYHCSHSNTDEVKGTFLTETGDYRYLEGVISNDSLYLSTFDGSHAFLFRSRLVNDTLWGDFLSGTHYQTKWYAVRNKGFELTNPDSLTYLVNDQPITLSLTDLDNNLYTYPNEKTKNKVTLIQIMGTWCPNCLDESRYLHEQKKKYGDLLEIIAVTFETQPTEKERIEKVKKYKLNLDLDYTFLMGGKASKTAAADLFPMVNNIISFPTLIFIDKSAKIVRIHTGFSGPGTGAYYENFVTNTNLFLEKLIKG